MCAIAVAIQSPTSPHRGCFIFNQFDIHTHTCRVKVFKLKKREQKIRQKAAKTKREKLYPKQVNKDA